MSKKSSKKINSETYWLIDTEGDMCNPIACFDSLEKLTEHVDERLSEEVTDLNTIEDFLKTFFIIKGTEIPFSITPPQSAKLIIKE